MRRLYRQQSGNEVILIVDILSVKYVHNMYRSVNIMKLIIGGLGLEADKWKA